MEAAPFIIYVIIMLVVGFSQYQKKQNEAHRRQAGPHTPKSPYGFPQMEPQMPKPVSPDMQRVDRIPGSGTEPGQRKTLQGPQALGTGKPVLHPIDVQKEYTEQRHKYEANPYGEGQAEIPKIVTAAKEVPQVSETAQAQQFWKKYDGVQSGEQTTLVPAKSQQAPLTELNPKTIAQGIILAEILQPPRARRPYRPLYEERNH